MKRNRRALWVAVLTACTLMGGCSAGGKTGEIEAGFIPLFNDTSLDGWIRRGGEASYRAEHGEIVGGTRPNQPNSFLCTAQDYGDFILELEFKVDKELNSGVQVRSQSLPDYQNGRVHGYQVEIDPSERAWTAGIYDEGRRGWLVNPDPKAAASFRQGDWNRLRIEANGDLIRTWLNGIPAAELRDTMTPRGFIALQVHGVGNRESELTIRWRDIRLKQLNTR